jgi:anti-sigma regulatory factor (Ser/Thr protein kinase)
MDGHSPYPLLLEPTPGSYAMFIPPDMSCIKIFRNALRESLKKNLFSDDDITQIELASDEALTNSISANVINHSEETIICRWMINDLKITLFILDYGSGYKSNPTIESHNASNMEDYLQNIKKYQATKPETLPYNGIKVGHKNVGKGLKIIHSLMDSVKIMFHVDGEVTESADDSRITGSIMELEYDRKKRSNQ